MLNCYIAILETIKPVNKKCSDEECYLHNVFTKLIYLIYMFKRDLALNNL